MFKRSLSLNYCFENNFSNKKIKTLEPSIDPCEDEFIEKFFDAIRLKDHEAVEQMLGNRKSLINCRVEGALLATPLMQAVDTQDLKMIRILLLHKPDALTKNLYGETALHIAVEKNNFEIVRSLIDYDPNTVMARTNTDNQLPFHKALANPICYDENPEIDEESKVIEIVKLLNSVTRNLSTDGIDEQNIWQLIPQVKNQQLASKLVDAVYTSSTTDMLSPEMVPCTPIKKGTNIYQNCFAPQKIKEHGIFAEKIFDPEEASYVVKLTPSLLLGNLDNLSI